MVDYEFFADECNCGIKHLDLASLDVSENCLGINSTVSADQPTTFTMLGKNFDKEQLYWQEESAKYSRNALYVLQSGSSMTRMSSTRGLIATRLTTTAASVTMEMLLLSTPQRLE